MQTTNNQLLLIEDNPADVLLFEDAIMQSSGNGFDITHLERAEDIETLSPTQNFDIVMMDMGLPGISGLDAVRFIQQCNNSLPIIILTGGHDDKQAEEAAKIGAQDYLIKGESNGDTILRSIRYSIQRKRYEEKISWLSCHDQLTGLINSDLFHTMFEQSVAMAKANRTKLGVYSIDLDNFGNVNDLHGQDVGNALLIEVAALLKDISGSGGLVARLGGDEFILIKPYEGDIGDCAEIATNIQHAVLREVASNSKYLNISASIGISVFPDGGQSARDLVQCSQRASRMAKKQGGNQFQFCTDDMNDEVSDKLRTIKALREDLERSNFHLCYHPKVNLKRNALIGAEALLRWHNDELGHVSPEVFIPLAEDNGLIDDITKWVLNTACEEYSREGMDDLNVAINISARQLDDGRIVSWVKEVLADSFFPANHLVLELTETAVMKDAQTALEILSDLKGLGVKLYVDDFGTGYSSLDYLRRFPVDALKIDRSFVMDMTQKPDEQRIVNLMVDLAHDLNMQVVAEGVETAGHVLQLQDMRCDNAQGFYYCKPLKMPDFRDWMQQFAA